MIQIGKPRISTPVSAPSLQRDTETMEVTEWWLYEVWIRVTRSNSINKLRPGLVFNQKGPLQARFKAVWITNMSHKNLLNDFSSRAATGWVLSDGGSRPEWKYRKTRGDVLIEISLAVQAVFPLYSIRFHGPLMIGNRVSYFEGSHTPEGEGLGWEAIAASHCLNL